MVVIEFLISFQNFNKQKSSALLLSNGIASAKSLQDLWDAAYISSPCSGIWVTDDIIPLTVKRTTC